MVVSSNNRNEFPCAFRLLPSYGFVAGYKAAIGISLERSLKPQPALGQSFSYEIGFDCISILPAVSVLVVVSIHRAESRTQLSIYAVLISSLLLPQLSLLCLL